MTYQPIRLKRGRRYRFEPHQAQQLCAMFEPLAVNAAFVRFMGYGKPPTITLRVKSATVDLSATWEYRFAGGATKVRLNIPDLPLP